MKITIKVESTDKEGRALKDAAVATAEMTAAFTGLSIGKQTVFEALDEIKADIVGGAVGDIGEMYGCTVDTTPTGKCHNITIDIPEESLTGGLDIITEFLQNVKGTVAPAVIATVNAIGMVFNNYGDKMSALVAKFKPTRQYGVIDLSSKDGHYVAIEVVQREKSPIIGKWAGIRPAHIPAGRKGDFKTHEEVIGRLLTRAIENSPDDITWLSVESHEDVWDCIAKEADRVWDNMAMLKLVYMRDGTGYLIGAEKRLLYPDGSERLIEENYPKGRPFESREGESHIYDVDDITAKSMWGTMKSAVNNACGASGDM